MTIQRYTQSLKTNGKYIFIATALLMLFSILGILRLEINTSFDVFTPPDSPRSRDISSMNLSFGDSSQLLVLADIGYGDEGQSQLRTVGQALFEVSGIAGIDSAARGAETTTGSGVGNTFLEPIAEMRNREGYVESDDTRYAILRLRLDEDADAKIIVGAVQDTFESADIPILVSGEPYLQAQIYRYIVKIITTIPPLAIVLMLIVFRIRIGSIRATLLSMVPAVVGAVITLGAVSWTRGSVSIVSVIVPIFVIVLGSASGLHITSHVIDALKSGGKTADAVTATLQSVGSAIVLTTVTTMAGFLSLLLMNNNAIRELGVTAAIGMLVAGIATWLILPAILLHQPPLKTMTSRRAAYSGQRVRKLRQIGGILLPVILVAAFLPGALNVRTNFSMIDMYRPSTDVRKGIELISNLLGGSIPVYVVAKPASDSIDVYDAGLAETFLELQRRVEDEGIVGRSVSAYAILADAYGNLIGNVERTYPRAALAKRIASAANAISPDTLGSFIADDATVRAAFFLKDLDRTTLDRFAGIVTEVSSAREVDLVPVGSAFAMKEMNDQITRQQFRSLLLAVFLVFALTAFSQRSVLLGFASAIPVAITLVVMFGVMSYAGIDLSIVTGIMSGLTIGVGIDYAVHYVSLYRKQKLRGDKNPTESALSYVATPVLANALGLAIGFTAMLLSPLSIHVTLSILMWVTMISSAVLSLTFLPTVTAWIHGFDAKNK